MQSVRTESILFCPERLIKAEEAGLNSARPLSSSPELFVRMIHVIRSDSWGSPSRTEEASTSQVLQGLVEKAKQV